MTQASRSSVGATATLALVAQFTEGCCCEAAFQAGKWCEHECCIEAQAQNEVCKKCNADAA